MTCAFLAICMALSGRAYAQHDASPVTTTPERVDACMTFERPLRLPLSFQDAHTARLGDVPYNRRMRADTRDCRVETANTTDTDAPSASRTE